MRGSKAEKLSAMPLERDDEPEPQYEGPYCVIRPDGFTYTVAIEPVLATGEGSPRSYGSKHEAFGAARDLWTRNKLPVLDLNNSKVVDHRE